MYQSMNTLIVIENTITQYLHLAAPLLNVPLCCCSGLGPWAAILGRLESGEQPETTCNRALFLTAVCPGYVLFEALHNDFSSFADYTLAAAATNEMLHKVIFRRKCSISKAWVTMGLRCLIDIRNEWVNTILIFDDEDMFTCIYYWKLEWKWPPAKCPCICKTTLKVTPRRSRG